MQILLDSTDLRQHYRILHLDTNNVGRDKTQRIAHTVWSLLLFVGKLAARRPKIVYLSITRSKLGCIKDCIMVSLARLCGARVLVHLRGGDLAVFYKTLSRFSKRLVCWVYRQVNLGIVLSESLRAQFNGLLPPDRVRVVLNCWYDGELDSLPLRRMERSPGSPLKLAFVSNVLPSKGLFDALEGVAWAVQSGVKLEFRFAGQFLDHDGALAKMPDLSQENLLADVLERKHEDLVKALGIEDCVLRLGVVTGRAKWHLLLQTDVLLLPIYNPSEGQPLVAIEAMRAGCAIICTSCGGLADIVEDGVTGRVVAPRMPIEIGEAIQWFWNHPVELGRIGRNNVQRAERLHSPKEHIRCIKNIFDEVLSTDGQSKKAGQALSAS